MLDPRVKLIAALAYMLGCLFVDSPAALALSASTLLLACAITRISPVSLLRRTAGVLVFLTLTALVNLLLVHTGTQLVALGPLSIYSGGLSAAALYGIRFFLLVQAGALLLATTSASTLTEAVRRLCAPLEALGLPVAQLAITFAIALRFAPILARDARSIFNAQVARGANFGRRGPVAYAKACIPLAVPLFASVVRHAEALAAAMEARCYTGGPRTSLHSMRVKPLLDRCMIAVTALYLFAVIAL